MTTLLKEIDVNVPLLVIMGFAMSSEIKKTLFGDLICFRGDFTGVDISTGKEVRSGVCHLPDVAASLLSNALEAAGGGVVEFNFNIGIIGSIKIRAVTQSEENEIQNGSRTSD